MEGNMVNLLKKYFYLLFVILIMICLLVAGGCALFAPPGKTDKAEIILDNSTLFDKNDLEQAVVLIKEKFKEFKGCELIKLWYDEEHTKREIENSYLSYLNDNKNIELIVFLCNYKTGRFSEPETSRNQTYTNFDWILAKDKDTGELNIIGWGYA